MRKRWRGVSGVPRARSAWPQACSKTSLPRCTTASAQPGCSLMRIWCAMWSAMRGRAARSQVSRAIGSPSVHALKIDEAVLRIDGDEFHAHAVRDVEAVVAVHDAALGDRMRDAQPGPLRRDA